MKIQGQIVSIAERSIFPGEITVENGHITSIEKKPTNEKGYLMPGFVDAHVHIESSMLVPSEFARLAVIHGTVATVSDPHEIGNVLGVAGVQFMVDNGNQVPFKFNFGAPSCVPATSFETAGAEIGPQEIRKLLEDPQIRYLAEMMNYPGVIYDDPVVHEKIAIAHELGKPVDGHAPGLRGEGLQKYLAAGISTDHECFTHEEALEKLNLGMKILIREGSAAKNFEALIGLLPDHYAHMMFCSDDKHPDDLIEGHINQLAARAIAKGMDLYKVLQVACLNPVAHYGLDVGQMRVGDPADFIRVNDLENFQVKDCWINGEWVSKAGQSQIQPVPVETLNHFNTSPKQPADFQIMGKASDIRVIEALDGELITRPLTMAALSKGDLLISDPSRDLLKIAVVNRYQDAPPAVAFIKGFGLKNGALASCVGHDSHNIIAVGTDDEQLCQAVNLIIQHKGGISAVSGDQSQVLPLPIAGIMSGDDGVKVGQAYAQIDAFAKAIGSTLQAPFMTLSFMALLVIPSLKLSDKGLFDGDKFEFVGLEA